MSQPALSPGVPVDPTMARRWVERSLQQGAVLASVIVRELDRFSVAALLAPAEYQGETLDDSGRGVRAQDADAMAVDYLRRLRPDAGCLLVEDDMALPGDQSLDDGNSDFSVVGGSVLRWVDLDASSDRLSWTLRAGSSRFPLNAFVVPEASSDVGLLPGEAVSADVVTAIARSVIAIIVSVFDAEAYVGLAARAPTSAG
ncbi:MAG: hypothetical protein ABJA74_13065 [Lapillicoccus sp.]